MVFKKKLLNFGFLSLFCAGSMLAMPATRSKNGGKKQRLEAVMPYPPSYYGSTPLIEASCDGNLREVRTVLDAKADINTTNMVGQTALMRAASMGNPAVVQALIQYGADKRIRDKHGKTALDIAYEQKYFDGVGDDEDDKDDVRNVIIDLLRPKRRKKSAKPRAVIMQSPVIDLTVPALAAVPVVMDLTAPAVDAMLVSGKR